ncbi:MAG: hypothetical protein M3O31_16030 [Acidobacteriota bacterium]|nr:hypothetical protein [Acidobacteriota bacterium]
MPVEARSFVAYPSALPGHGDAIEAAVKELNSGSVVTATSWTSLAITGRPIIGTICEEIQHSELLIADITNLNPNVLFELGYAITQRKRVWPIFNDRVAGSKRLFDRFQLLTTTGYTAYSNSHDIISKFYEHQPYRTLDKSLYDELLQAASVTPRDGCLLYIKPEISTEAVSRIARRVSGAPITPVIDDPEEIEVQSLEWYLANVTAAQGVVCHFLSDDYEDVRISNAKGALVAGLTYGLGKPLLMLAHKPYQSPIDYRDLLRPHKDASQAESFYQAWLSHVLEIQKEQVKHKSIYTHAVAAHGGLLALNIGDPIAEFEPEKFPEYFIPTSAYAEALNGQHSIFVGRKGAGKTATLLKVVDELSDDPRNHICVIKPVDYELDGLLALLQKQFTVSEKGFLVESFWKCLIYTELARSVYETISAKPDFVGRSDAEEALTRYVESNTDLILPEFSTRMENLVGRLSSISDGQDVKNKISEGVHKLVLNRLRDLLLGALEKVNAVSVLVDNLDKNWTPRSNIQLVSELLFGLLSVGVRIAEDFKKSSLGSRRLEVMMTIFIRSDIYAATISYAREPDKLPVRKIEWDDPALLMRVIEKRISISDRSLVDGKEAWDKYFVETVKGIATRDFLVQAVFPRPRDLIYLVRSSLQFAINRGHTKVEDVDVRSGLEQYSSFAFYSLMTEGTPQFRSLQEFMYQLFGGPTTLTDDDVRTALAEAGLGITNAAFVIDLLQDLSFLSYEVTPGRFTFAYEREQKPKLAIMARKTARATKANRYSIHQAFHPYLELKAENEVGQFPISF